VLVCLYASLALSLDLLVGHTGYLSLSHGAFFGLGAYCFGLMTEDLRVTFGTALLGSVVVGIASSVALSLASIRLKEDFFLIGTLGFQMLFFTVVNNWLGVTRGPLGLSIRQRPEIFSWQVDAPVEFLALALILLMGSFGLVRLLVTSPFGRVLHAIREDEIVALAAGKNPNLFQIQAFAASAAIASAAGSIHGSYLMFVHPSSFTATESVLLISMVIVGGSGSSWGPIGGAVLLTVLPEVLRFLGLPIPVAANLRQIIYGILLVGILILRPEGLAGEFAASQRSEGGG